MPYADPERARRHKRRYYLKNRERIKAKQREYNRLHPLTPRQRKRGRERTAKYRAAHPIRVRRQSRIQTKKQYANIRAYNRRIKLAAFEAYGGPICTCCKETQYLMLTIDHIAGGGAKHRRRLGGGGNKLYLWLKRKKYPPGFRVLCFNCNAATHFNKGICPHVQIPRTVPDSQ